MNRIRSTSAGTWLGLALGLVLIVFAAGCDDSDDSGRSLSPFADYTGAEAAPVAEVQQVAAAENASASTGAASAVADRRDAPATPSTPGATEPPVTPVPDPVVEEPEPEPEPEPPVIPTGNSPRYSPGQVVIPDAFLAHGTMTELRFQHCSTRNGLMKPLSSTVYSLPPPSDPVWRQTSGTAIGTKARFADGAVYDGYVHDYHGSYPMPIQPLGATSGRAFWVRVQ